MKKYVLLIAVCTLCLFSFSTANAAYIDLRPDGISMSTDGALYDPIDNDVSIEVWIMSSGVDYELEGWSFDILYDMSESITYTGGMDNKPLGWFDMGQHLVDLPPYVQHIEAVTFGSGIKTDGLWEDGWLAATLNFSFDRDSIVFDGTPDFSVYYRPGQGLNIDTDGVIGTELKPESIGPDIAAVPIPAAVWLLGSGLLGLVGIRRKVK